MRTMRAIGGMDRWAPARHHGRRGNGPLNPHTHRTCTGLDQTKL